jgi:hypothetical protein
LGLIGRGKVARETLLRIDGLLGLAGGAESLAFNETFLPLRRLGLLGLAAGCAESLACRETFFLSLRIDGLLELTGGGETLAFKDTFILPLLRMLGLLGESGGSSPEREAFGRKAGLFGERGGKFIFFLRRSSLGLFGLSGCGL